LVFKIIEGARRENMPALLQIFEPVAGVGIELSGITKKKVSIGVVCEVILHSLTVPSTMHVLE
jgi:hypothetical protein